MLKEKEELYLEILDFLCAYRGITRKELLDILKDKEMKYLLFLILKKYKCTHSETIIKLLSLKSKSSVGVSFRKAEERFFINRDFREKYFRIEEEIEEVI